jgi:hypothetical protein
MSSPQPDGQIKASTQGEGGYAVITHRKRVFEVYHVLKEDLNRLASGFVSVHFGLLGIMVGAALSMIITYVTVPLAEPLKTRFWAASLIFSIGAIYCAIMAFRDWRAACNEVERIKRETTTENIVVDSIQK